MFVQARYGSFQFLTGLAHPFFNVGQTAYGSVFGSWPPRGGVWQERGNHENREDCYNLK